MKTNDLRIIQKLKLLPHPEGGYYKEVYKAADEYQTKLGTRSASTAIYFLLEKGNFSAFHRIQSDELWHHYEGCSLEIFIIDEQGKLEVLKLGKNFEKGEEPLRIVRKGLWFASRVQDEGYALVGCTVSPGFDFKDFELASRSNLLSLYPEHKQVIEELTRR